MRLLLIVILESKLYSESARVRLPENTYSKIGKLIKRPSLWACLLIMPEDIGIL
jgi:hypothetical protein